MVELTPYNSIPHALCPAVTDPKKVSAALNWIVGGIAVVGIAGAIALIRLMPIGYVITVILAGLGLFNTLASTLAGQGDDLRLAVSVVAVLYLNQPAVRAVFGRGKRAQPASKNDVQRGAELAFGDQTAALGHQLRHAALGQRAQLVAHVDGVERGGHRDLGSCRHGPIV